jgi:hypothetical protein
VIENKGKPKMPLRLSGDIDENRGHDLSDNKGMTSASR